MEIRYARSGEVEIAYRTLGTGPLTLVYVGGSFSNLEVMWEHPDYRSFCERLAAFSRLVLFDKRGMGLSDRVEVGTLEERMDDVRAVTDAVGAERVALLGVSEGGPMSLLFAATYPERTSALVLCGAEVKEETTEDWPWGEMTRTDFERAVGTLPERWGKGLSASKFLPSAADPDFEKRWWAKLQVQSASPRVAVAFQRMAFDIDVRHVVPTITAPTLIIHRVGDKICHVENARFLASKIEGSRYIELPGEDHVPSAGGGSEIVDEIQEFLTGVREPEQPDRVLATVLFTDIVGSTERARDLGDRGWRELLDRHHAAVRHELTRFLLVVCRKLKEFFCDPLENLGEPVRHGATVPKTDSKRRPRGQDVPGVVVNCQKLVDLNVFGRQCALRFHGWKCALWGMILQPALRDSGRFGCALQLLER